MTRKTATQSSFNAGVMSPRLWGRSDYQKYDNAVAVLSNSIGTVSGPIVFRPGTTYVYPAITNTGVSWLIPFKFNTEQAYMLEFTDNKIRFFRNRGVILSSTVITNGTFTTDLSGWTTANTGTGSATQGTGRANIAGGSSGLGAMYQQLNYIGINQYTVTLDVVTNSINYKVGTAQGLSDIASGTLTVGTGKTFNFTRATAGSVFLQFENPNNNTSSIDNIVLSTPEYVINTPYTGDMLSQLSFAQDADVLYLAYKSKTIATKVLQRFGHANWTLTDHNFIDGPYEDQNTTSTYTMTPSATTGSVTVTASQATFVATDVGRAIRINNASGTSVSWGWGLITAFTSSTVVTVQVKSDFSTTTATPNWRLGSFGNTLGYPGLVTFHEFRQAFASTDSYPNKVWLSESQGAGKDKVLFAPSNIAGTVLDSSSINFPLSAGDVSTVLWLSSGATLAVGTADSEWVIESGDTSKALTPTTARATRKTTHGSAPNVPAVRIDGTVMYAQGTGHKVDKFVFDFSKDRYLSTNMAVLAEHLFTNKSVNQMVYAKEPFSVMWVRMNDGTLNALTFVDAEEVGGWSYHKISGTFGGGNAVVESMAVIPAQDRSYDEVYLVVKRTINGQQVKYIEVMENQFFNQPDPQNAIYVDAALKYSGTPATVISGLSHLEGQTVTVMVDAASHPDAVVSSGQITLNGAASTVVVGLAYTGDVESLDFDSPNAFSTSSLGQIRRISDVQVRLFESGPVYTRRANQDDSKLSLLEPRSSDDLMDTATGLKSGIFEVYTESEWNFSSRLHLQYRSPFPATISAIMFKAQVDEG